MVTLRVRNFYVTTQLFGGDLGSLPICGRKTISSRSDLAHSWKRRFLGAAENMTIPPLTADSDGNDPVAFFELAHDFYSANHTPEHGVVSVQKLRGGEEDVELTVPSIAIAR